MLLLIGPAVFFVLYWLYTGGDGNPPSSISPPGDYRQAGEPAIIDGSSIVAAPGGKVAYSQELKLGNNRILAEAGYIFVVIPLVLPEKSNDPPPTRWNLVDGEGNTYSLLKTLAKNPAGEAAASPVAFGGRTVYLVFKVDKNTGDTFLVHSAASGDAAWKIPRPPD